MFYICTYVYVFSIYIIYIEDMCRPMQSIFLPFTTQKGIRIPQSTHPLFYPPLSLALTTGVELRGEASGAVQDLCRGRLDRGFAPLRPACDDRVFGQAPHHEPPHG